MKSEWISIKNQFPEPGNWVITSNEGYHGGHLCWFDSDGNFYIDGRGRYSKIWMSKDKATPTHWQYFPAPVGVPDYPLNYVKSAPLKKHIGQIR